MEVSVHVCLTEPTPGTTRILTQRPDGVDFQAPPPLVEAGFPVNQTFFPIERVSPSAPASTVFNTYLKDVATAFNQRQNTVIFTYGAMATPKRAFLYASDGLAALVLRGVMSAPLPGYTYTAQCYALGVTENVKDLLDLRNDQGVVTDSVKEGPKVRQVERVTLRSAADVVALLEGNLTFQKPHHSGHGRTGGDARCQSVL